MDTNNYPEIVLEWMEIAKQSARTDSARMNEYLEKLRHYAEDNGSIYLIGFCFYCQGHDAYSRAELDLAMECMTEALKYLSMAEDWATITKCYNIIGNIATFQGDMSLATDCYVKGLSTARLHEIKDMEYNIRNNIANIHMMLSDYKNALDMLESSAKMTANGLQIPDSQRSVIAANLAVCCTQLGMLDRAADYLDKVKKFIGGNPDVKEQIMIHILDTQYFNRTGNTTARDESIRKLNSLDITNLHVYDALTELSDHAKLLLDIDKTDVFNALVHRMEQLAENPTVKRHCLELRMKQCRINGDSERYAKLAVEYYDVAQQREIERNRIASHNIVTRIRLEEEESKRKDVEKSNVVLRERSEHDALTGLNNRFKLNELSEAAFQRSYLSQKPLTVEILDIDCYKHFNDNYGHQAGDDCLVEIAHAIRSMEELPRIHTARYGGDEFVVVYEEYSLDEIKEMAALLHKKIADLNIEHKFSTVCDRITISQGLFHMAPQAGNKLWDFMYSADMALYIVKNRSKNDFHIATDFDVVREEYKSIKK